MEIVGIGALNRIPQDNDNFDEYTKKTTPEKEKVIIIDALKNAKLIKED